MLIIVDALIMFYLLFWVSRHLKNQIAFGKVFALFSTVSAEKIISKIGSNQVLIFYG
jgi:hypothetical protein